MRGNIVKVMAFVFVIGLFSPSTGFSIGLGDMAPDFTIESMDGRKISYFSDLKGKKPLYLVFWATW
jgi:hypothetical protein